MELLNPVCEIEEATKCGVGKRAGSKPLSFKFEMTMTSVDFLEYEKPNLK